MHGSAGVQSENSFVQEIANTRMKIAKENFAVTEYP